MCCPADNQWFSVVSMSIDVHGLYLFDATQKRNSLLHDFHFHFHFCPHFIELSTCCGLVLQTLVVLGSWVWVWHPGHLIQISWPSGQVIYFQDDLFGSFIGIPILSLPLSWILFKSLLSLCELSADHICLLFSYLCVSCLCHNFAWLSRDALCPCSVFKMLWVEIYHFHALASTRKINNQYSS